MCMQGNLALCCKAMLPLLYMGFVRVRLDKAEGERPLSRFTRCLSQQPDGVVHLKLFSNGWPSPQPADLVDLRYE